MAISSCLIFLVFSHLVIFHFAVGQNQSPSRCPKSFECGNVGTMSFPFTKRTDPGCGLSMVDCESNPPKLQLGPNGYWYDMLHWVSEYVVLVNASSLELNSCSSLSNLSLPDTPLITFKLVSPNITLFKCLVNPDDKSSDQHFHRHGYENLNCEEPDLRVYVKHPEERDSSVAGSLPPNCALILLPSHPDTKLNTTDMFKLFSNEFELECHLSHHCYDCHRRGGRCLTGSNNQFYCSSSKGNRKFGGVILGIVVSVGGVVMLAIIVFFLRRKYSILDFKRDKYKNVEIFLKNNGKLAPKRYNYSEVKKMTSSFKTSLGKGGYGSVYKGKLRDGTLVAVKILNDTKGNGEEFINEVASISRTSHVNIVKLLGFCFQGNKRALIYEFMPNGSLEKFIYDKQSSQDRQLGWLTLYKIAVGIARGLEYLHRGCNTQILHFDIKPHNILLDEDFFPKISDFGLSQLCTRTKSIVSILGARGTIGYIAPEVVCRTFGWVSHKSDVYSYGMMILEIVGGRKNVDVGVEHTSEIYYPHWVFKQLEQNQELGFDGILNEEENEKARKMIIVSLWCIQTDPSTRPPMNKVVEMLEGNLESLLVPPKPYLYSPSRSPVESQSLQVT